MRCMNVEKPHSCGGAGCPTGAGGGVSSHGGTICHPGANGIPSAKTASGAAERKSMARDARSFGRIRIVIIGVIKVLYQNLCG